MKTNISKLTLFITASVFVFANISPASDHPETSSVPPDEALAKLTEGNKRFANSKVSTEKPTAARRAETAQTQHPFAIIVGCADSRTSPEIVFDQNLGDLFVIRTAGNLVDDYALGTIEYGVEHLGARLVVVLGHQRCGAVKAALESESAPGHINTLVRAIQPAVKAVKNKQGDPLANAAHENALEVAEKIRKNVEVGELSSQIRVVSGYYNLDTGKIEWDK